MWPEPFHASAHGAATTAARMTLEMNASFDDDQDDDETMGGSDAWPLLMT